MKTNTNVKAEDATLNRKEVRVVSKKIVGLRIKTQIKARIANHNETLVR